MVNCEGVKKHSLHYWAGIRYRKMATMTETGKQDKEDTNENKPNKQKHEKGEEHEKKHKRNRTLTSSRGKKIAKLTLEGL